jgi:hypothetical protein
MVLPSLRSLTGGGRQSRSHGLAPLLGFLPLRHLWFGAASRAGATNLRLAGAAGFSPSHALHSTPIRSGLVSCRWRPWGCALQSLDPPGSPCPSRGRVPSWRRFRCRCASRPWYQEPSSVRAGWRGSRQRMRVSMPFLSDRQRAYVPCRLRNHSRWVVGTTCRMPLEGRRTEVRRESPRARGRVKAPW